MYAYIYVTGKGVPKTGKDLSDELGKRLDIEITQNVDCIMNADITSLDEIVDVLENNHFRKSEWKRLGLSLGLYHPTLECIDKKYREDPHLCFQECLACWLYRQDKVQKKGCTWESLASAVQNIGYHMILPI